eukprot:jgi/Ulvmu1/6351/UM029_0059.1
MQEGCIRASTATFEQLSRACMWWTLLAALAMAVGIPTCSAHSINPEAHLQRTPSRATPARRSPLLVYPGSTYLLHSHPRNGHAAFGSHDSASVTSVANLRAAADAACAGECVEDYGQCAGAGMLRTLRCCSGRFHCVRENGAYSQCRLHGIPGGFEWDGVPMVCTNPGSGVPA